MARKNNPFKARKETLGKQVTLLTKIAEAAEKERAASNQGNYDEGSFWAGYRNAFSDMSRLLEFAWIWDGVGTVAFNNGLKEYEEWLKKREQ